jgi:hypothetical protein
MKPQYLKIPDAVIYSGVSRSSLYVAMARGVVIARKSGKSTLIDRESLDKYLEGLPRAEIRLPSAVRAVA